MHVVPHMTITPQSALPSQGAPQNRLLLLGETLHHLVDPIPVRRVAASQEIRQVLLSSAQPIVMRDNHSRPSRSAPVDPHAGLHRRLVRCHSSLLDPARLGVSYMHLASTRPDLQERKANSSAGSPLPSGSSSSHSSSPSSSSNSRSAAAVDPFLVPTCWTSFRINFRALTGNGIWAY